MSRSPETGWVIWFVGLPGSGKSTYANAVLRALKENGVDARYLSMDEFRRERLPAVGYTEAERKETYRLFAEEAARAARAGHNVIMDGTAYRLSIREFMRGLVPRFAEIYIRCPLKTAIERESGRPEGRVMAGLYRKALARKETGKYFKGLGEVVGVDVEFEENPLAECVLDCDKMNIEEGRDRVLEFLAGWGRTRG